MLSMVESPSIKVDRRGLAASTPQHMEPPSPMSHAKILARHATFAPRTEEEKAFGCPIPSPTNRSGENDDPGRSGSKKALASTSPRPAGRATIAGTTPDKKKESATSPRRKFSFPKMGFFTRGAKQRDAPSPARLRRRLVSGVGGRKEDPPVARPVPVLLPRRRVTVSL